MAEDVRETQNLTRQIRFLTGLISQEEKRLTSSQHTVNHKRYNRKVYPHQGSSYFKYQHGTAWIPACQNTKHKPIITSTSHDGSAVIYRHANKHKFIKHSSHNVSIATKSDNPLGKGTKSKLQSVPTIPPVDCYSVQKKPLLLPDKNIKSNILLNIPTDINKVTVAGKVTNVDTSGVSKMTPRKMSESLVYNGSSVGNVKQTGLVKSVKVNNWSDVSNAEEEKRHPCCRDNGVVKREDRQDPQRRSIVVSPTRAAVNCTAQTSSISHSCDGDRKEIPEGKSTFLDGCHGADSIRIANSAVFSQVVNESLGTLRHAASEKMSLMSDIAETHRKLRGFQADMQKALEQVSKKNIKLKSDLFRECSRVAGIKSMVKGSVNKRGGDPTFVTSEAGGSTRSITPSLQLMRKIKNKYCVVNVGNISNKVVHANKVGVKNVGGASRKSRGPDSKVLSILVESSSNLKRSSVKTPSSSPLFASFNAYSPLFKKWTRHASESKVANNAQVVNNRRNRRHKINRRDLYRNAHGTSLYTLPFYSKQHRDAFKKINEYSSDQNVDVQRYTLRKQCHSSNQIQKKVTKRDIVATNRFEYQTTHQLNQTNVHHLPTHGATPLFVRLKRREEKMRKSKRSTKRTEQNYCIYFTKFGRCFRKESCPFIHDKTRVVTCRRFLQGKCQRKDCPFSHVVSRHMTPTCSHFLRGMCTRDACRYPHVNVGKDAPTCDEFQRGFCHEGDKCKKKHVYLTSQLRKVKMNKKMNKSTNESSVSLSARKTRVDITGTIQPEPEIKFTGYELPSFISLIVKAAPPEKEVIGNKQSGKDVIKIKPLL